MKTTTYTSSSLEETRELGFLLAKEIKNGDVVGFNGNFGSGKTFLIKCICEAFGIDPSLVTSPSFTIIHEYSGKQFKVVHIDTYRLNSVEEFDWLDLEYYENQGAVLMIEWAEKFVQAVPSWDFWIDMEVTGASMRVIHVKRERSLS